MGWLVLTRRAARRLAGRTALPPSTQVRIESLAAPGQELQLVRVEVAAGAVVASPIASGPSAMCVESGSVIVGMGDSAVTVTRAARAVTPTVAESRGTGETELSAGDCVNADVSRTPHTLRNSGGPAVIWQAQLAIRGEATGGVADTPAS